MDLVGRVKGLLLDPKAEWQVIAGEQTSPGDLIKNYVAILAAIPAVCGFIGASIIGVARNPDAVHFGDRQRDRRLRADHRRCLRRRVAGQFPRRQVRRAEQFPERHEGRRLRADRRLGRERVHRIADPRRADGARPLQLLSLVSRASDPDADGARQDARLSAVGDRLHDHRMGLDPAAARAALVRRVSAVGRRQPTAAP